MALLPESPPALLSLLLITAGVALTAWRRFPLAYSMGAISIGVFAIQLAGPSFGVRCFVGPVRVDCVSFELGFVVNRFLDGAQWWSPFTYMFVHGGFLHVAGNLFILLTAGPLLEDKIGSRRFLLVYVVSGVAAAFATFPVVLLGLVPGLVFSIPNVGASGAIFGILTTFAWLYPRERLPIPLGIGIAFIFWLPAFAVLAIHLGFNVVSILAGDNVAWWGHLGGFFVGLAFAVALPGWKATSKVRPVDADALRPLAATPALEDALAQIELLNDPRTKDDPHFQEAWLDRFFSQAACPRCAGPLIRDGERARSECGYEIAFRA